MIDLSLIDEIYLFTGATDFRYGLYGLSKIIMSNFNNKQIKHNLYLFCSKSRKGIKIIEFDENGIWLYQKKLNTGKFIYPDAGNVSTISKDNLQIILNGLDFIYKIEGKLNKNFDEF